MSMMAAHNLQIAVYEHLVNAPDLAVPVYDEPPAGAQLPYISLGDTSIANADTKSEAASRIDFDVSVWSGEESQMQAKELMALIDAVLHTADLTVAGHSLGYLRLQNAGVSRQFRSTGSLYRGRLAYRALLFQNS